MNDLAQAAQDAAEAIPPENEQGAAAPAEEPQDYEDVAEATSELEEEEFDEDDIQVDFSNIQNINIATDEIEVSDSDEDEDLTEF